MQSTFCLLQFIAMFWACLYEPEAQWLLEATVASASASIAAFAGGHICFLAPLEKKKGLKNRRHWKKTYCLTPMGDSIITHHFQRFFLRCFFSQIPIRQRRNGDLGFEASKKWRRRRRPSCSHASCCVTKEKCPKGLQSRPNRAKRYYFTVGSHVSFLLLLHDFFLLFYNFANCAATAAVPHISLYSTITIPA